MTKTATAQPRAPIKAIVNLVNYLYEDECRHYEGGFCDDDGNLIDDAGADHIFLSVKKVSDWLDRLEAAKEEVRRLKA